MKKKQSFRSVESLLRGGSGTGYPANRRRSGGEMKQGRTVRIKAVPRSGMKQYGDKGYKPSSGKGVGY